jgi:hypothetical protein
VVRRGRKGILLKRYLKFVTSERRTEMDCSSVFNSSSKASYLASSLSGDSLWTIIFPGSLVTDWPVAQPRRKPTDKIEKIIFAILISSL